MLKLTFICVWVALSTTVAHAAYIDPVDRIVLSEMQRQRSPAISIAVVRNGVVLKEKGYGLANLEQQSAASAATVYQTASVGKQFTAALVMLLVRDGKLSLDEPVSSYFPEAPPSWARITVRHLLNHTAGVDQSDAAIDLRKDYTEAELLESAYKLPLKSLPGEKHLYSTLGHQILGFLCSKVGRKHWGEQMRERIFLPLGMTARVISEQEIIPKRAAGYQRVMGQFSNQLWVAPSQNTTADGSLYMSARDMVRWSLALQSEKLLTTAEKEAMWQPAKLSNGALEAYGLGWRLFKDAGHRAVCHDGNWQGFTANICHLPEDRLTISVLMNRANAQVQVVADRIAAHYVPALRKPPVPVPQQASLLQKPLFLRGTMNDWQSIVPFVKTGLAVLEARTVLATGLQEFKIADADWQLAEFGVPYDEALLKVGSTQNLAFKAENVAMEVLSPGEHTFRLTVPAKGPPTLTVFPTSAGPPKPMGLGPDRLRQQRTAVAAQ